MAWRWARVRAHRRGLQRDVQHLAGVQLHRGALGMLGGVFGALFIDRLGLPGIVGLLATLACCAVVGVVTSSLPCGGAAQLDQHLYVLSTLALCLMIQQFTASNGAPCRSASPAHSGGSVGIRERFWMPVVACVLVSRLQWLYRNSMIGRPSSHCRG